MYNIVYTVYTGARERGARSALHIGRGGRVVVQRRDVFVGERAVVEPHVVDRALEVVPPGLHLG